MKLKFISKTKSQYVGFEPISFRKVKVFSSPGADDIIVTEEKAKQLMADYPLDWKQIAEDLTSIVEANELNMLTSLAEKKSKKKGK